MFARKAALTALITLGLFSMFFALVRTGSSSPAGGSIGFLPMLISNPAPTPTPEPTVIIPPTPGPNPSPTATIAPTATSQPSQPMPPGATVCMRTYGEVPLHLFVTSSEFRQVLTPQYGAPVTPEGIFLVVIATVTNQGKESGSVGTVILKARDAIARQFDMAPLDAQFAAQYEYQLLGAYDAVQPGLESPRVLVFDVAPQYLPFTLSSTRPC